jgi:hypothetical protein
VNATVKPERDRRARLPSWTWVVLPVSPLWPHEGVRCSGLVVAAVASSPQMTGATGRCLLHIPFGISAVRESRVQPPIDRSKQAG